MKKKCINNFLFEFLFFVSVLGSIFLINAVEVDAQEEPIVGSIYNFPGCECSLELDTRPEKVVNSIQRTSLSSSVDFRTSSFLPPVCTQIGNSCGAWSTVYYQYTYETARLKQVPVGNNTNYIYSPKYIWNYLNDGANKGVDTLECYGLLEKQGCLTWSQFPHTSEEYDWYDTSTITALANTYSSLETRISNSDYFDFAPIQTNATQPVITSNADEDLYYIKSKLNEGHCLVIHTYCSSFVTGTLSNGELCVLYMNGTNGYHAMTVVGYNDNICFDLNQNGTIEDAEKGAFLLVNSHGPDYANDGYIWIMYDSLNKVSAAGIVAEGREPLVHNNRFRYIDVEEYTPQYTVEVTLNQKYRNDISVSLLRNGIGSTAAEEQTFLTGYTAVTTGENKKYNIDFDGNRTNPQYDSRTFVFDYDAYDLYDGTGYYYGIKIHDINENNAITTVERIVWKNGDTVIKEITPNRQLDGGNVSYYTPAQLATGLTLSHSQKTLREGDSHTLTATVLPADATVNSFYWESSNTSCVTVSSSGIVTAVGPGTATVTAYTNDGTEFSASCTYTVLNAFGDKWETAENCVYGTNKTMFSAADQECWAKYTPTETGTYLFYSLGNLDVVGGLYNEIADTIGQNNNISTSNKNFLFSANLTAGQTYRLIISSSVDDIGEFSFCVMKKEPYDPMYSSNYDARKIHFYVSAPSVYDSVRIGLGNYEINLTGQKITTNGYSNATVIYNGIKVKAILFAETPAVTYWTIYVDVSDVAALVGNAIDIDVEFYCGNVSGGEYNIGTGVIAYKTSLLSGVEVDASNSLQLLLDDITVANGEYLTVLNSNKQAITVTSTTKAATGMIILRKSSANNLIKEVMFVILIGDAQGDGYINSLDASLILQYDAETQEITGAYLIAADANFDGDVNNLDSSTILNYDAEIIDISQNLGTTVAPDWVYYQYEVEF